MQMNGIMRTQMENGFKIRAYERMEQAIQYRSCMTTVMTNTHHLTINFYVKYLAAQISFYTFAVRKQYVVS